MSFFIFLTIINIILGIMLTYKLAGLKLMLTKSWLFGIVLGLLGIIYITIPLMEWSVILFVLFYVLAFVQFAGLVLHLIPTSNTKFILEK